MWSGKPLFTFPHQHVFGFWDLLWVSQGQYFIFGALCPSKSGLMNKHIVKHTVKHIVKHNAVASYLGFETLWVL